MGSYRPHCSPVRDPISRQVKGLLPVADKLYESVHIGSVMFHSGNVNKQAV